MSSARFRFDAALSPSFTITLVLLVVLFSSQRATAEPAQTPLETRAVQALVDKVRARLAIRQPVTLTLVEHNPLVASVARDTGPRSAFVLSIERGFAETLTDAELLAVVAHELGHVWIFTHHPYLQTESLANHVALRVVARERLEAVYEKVWRRVGEKSTLARFMSPATPAAPAAQPVGLAHSAVEPVRTAAPR